MHLSPIYTVDAECQDCCKCIRQCPVKAIKVENGHARVIPERCIACGHCVEACPSGAKRVRDDRGSARELLRSTSPVYVSLAPAWVSEFAPVSPEQMVAGLRRLGFAGAGETALGAQEVTTALVEKMHRQVTPSFLLSSACPAAVELTRKYFPDLVDLVTPLASPLLAHCQLLRENFGTEIGVVFFGPCVAKKHEADDHPDLLDFALTFHDLHEWLAEEGIDLLSLTPEAGDDFTPHRAGESALYPLEGGMLENIRLTAGRSDLSLETLSGVRTIQDSLGQMAGIVPDRPVFVEMLACSGGCAKGPCTSHYREEISSRLQIRRYAGTALGETRMKATLWGKRTIRPAPVAVIPLCEEEILAALRRVGKRRSEDELNCGGCGYETCRDFAVAMLEEKAEPTMCVSFLRTLAARKANALLRCMPSGVVIVDASLTVIESNESFARMLGDDAVAVYEARPGMAGASLDRLLPFSEYFQQVVETGIELSRDNIHFQEQLLTLTVFPIEPGQVVGGILFDVTMTEQRRDQIAHHAREVIKRNLSTVQEIACRLGEHMAETEVLLRSIADGYGR